MNLTKVQLVVLVRFSEQASRVAKFIHELASCSRLINDRSIFRMGNDRRMYLECRCFADRFDLDRCRTRSEWSRPHFSMQSQLADNEILLFF